MLLADDLSRTGAQFLCKDHDKKRHQSEVTAFVMPGITRGKGSRKRQMYAAVCRECQPRMGNGFKDGRFDLMQERRVKQEQRLQVVEFAVRCWMGGQWRATSSPCGCGHNHYSIQSRSRLGLEEHCPVTWWGLLVWIGGAQIELSSVVKPIITIKEA